MIIKSDVMVPKLRFPTFNENWNSASLKSYVLEHKGGAPLKPEDFVDLQEYEVVPKKAIMPNGKLMLDKNQPTYCSESFFKSHENSVINAGYLLTTLRDLVPSGPSIGYIVEFSQHEKYMLAQGVYGFRINEDQLNRNFLIQFSNTDKYRRLMRRLKVGSTQVHIRNNDFFGITINFPLYDEQQKIANFLSSVDKKIQQLTEKQSLLQQYKKGIMQKLFSQEIRFKDEQGNDFPDWEEKKFGGLFQRVTNKNKENNSNVLTISAQRGLINQEKYFNKSVSAKDVTGYYLIEKGSFAYNKSYSKGYPMGAIKRLNNYEKGVVSTLYICFKAINGVSDEFYEQYFDAGLLNREIHKIAQEGARNHGLLNVSVTAFFRDMKINKPCLAEQNKIASFLGALDKKIDFTNQQIEQTKTFKKGLLQQMFV